MRLNLNHGHFPKYNLLNTKNWKLLKGLTFLNKLSFYFFCKYLKYFNKLFLSDKHTFYLSVDDLKV